MQAVGQDTDTRAHGKSAVPESAYCADRSNLSTEQDDVPYGRAAGPLNTYVYVYASDERGRAALDGGSGARLLELPLFACVEAASVVLLYEHSVSACRMSMSPHFKCFE